MNYIISFVVLARRSQPILMEGPVGFDVYAEYDKFKRHIEERLGNEPNFLECTGSWALHRLEVLREYQQQYNCKGDYGVIFIEHLKQRCGFVERTSIDVRLA